MHPEKEIVNLWLNKKGFFTVGNITAARNREIDLLAINNKTNEIWHVEIVSSITSVDTLSEKDVIERFDNQSVIKAVQNRIKQYTSSNTYKKVLVLGKTSRLLHYKNLKNITTFSLSEVIFDVFNEIDTHNYRNVALRTLQLVKFLLISEPSLLANLLDKKDDNKILNLNTREQFLKALMEQDETKRVLGKNSFEPELIKIIKNSTLNKPEKLAKALEEKVLSARSRKKFVETIMQYSDMKKEIKQSISKDQKTLEFFAE